MYVFWKENKWLRFLLKQLSYFFSWKCVYLHNFDTLNGPFLVVATNGTHHAWLFSIKEKIKLSNFNLIGQVQSIGNLTHVFKHQDYHQITLTSNFELTSMYV